jgi:hypothetical protein
MTRRILLTTAALVGALALGACGRGSGGEGNNVSALDNELVANEADSALTSALGNQINVDPLIANGQKPAANGQAAAEGGGAAAGSVQKARLVLNGADNKGCAGDPSKFENANQWAERLPAAFGNYPGAKVAEAAANN